MQRVGEVERLVLGETKTSKRLGRRNQGGTGDIKEVAKGFDFEVALNDDFVIVHDSKMITNEFQFGFKEHRGLILFRKRRREFLPPPFVCYDLISFSLRQRRYLGTSYTAA